MEYDSEEARSKARFDIKNHRTIDLRGISTLRLYPNDLDTDACKLLGAALTNNWSVTSLLIFRNAIGAEGTKYICEGLKENKTLTNLEFTSNNLQVAGMDSIADLLKTNTTLRSLHLLDNCDAGSCAQLGAALKSNRSLTYLTIQDSPIGDIGAELIANMLKVNKTLLGIQLRGSEMTSVGSGFFQDVLRFNTTILKIGLKDNSVTSWQRGNIKGLLLRNRKFHGQRILLDSIVLLFNIARDEAVLKLVPKELWLIVFRYIQLDYWPLKKTVQKIAQDVFKDPIRIRKVY